MTLDTLATEAHFARSHRITVPPQSPLFLSQEPQVLPFLPLQTSLTPPSPSNNPYTLSPPSQPCNPHPLIHSPTNPQVLAPIFLNLVPPHPSLPYLLPSFHPTCYLLPPVQLSQLPLLVQFLTAKTAALLTGGPCTTSPGPREPQRSEVLLYLVNCPGMIL